MQINAIKFRLTQSDDPITYKFSQSTGNFTNFQSVLGPKPLLTNISGALEFALSGNLPFAIFDAVLQVSDQAGNTWIVHRTLSTLKVVKNGTLLPESGLSELQQSFYDHLEESSDGLLPGFSINKQKILTAKNRLIAVEFTAPDEPGADVRQILEDQIASLTRTYADIPGLTSLIDPGLLIRFASKIDPLYTSYREVCRQYKMLQGSTGKNPADSADEIKALETQIEVINLLEQRTDKYLSPNFNVNKGSEDLAALDSNIAEMASALNTSPTDSTLLIKDFRKPIEALARLETFAKLVRASQGARKYCEQKIEPLYKKYLEYADRNLASNREIASELESCLSTLALRLRVEPLAKHDSAPHLKTWFDKFKSKVSTDDIGQTNLNSQNDFDTARLAIEYAVTQLNEMASHLKKAVTHHDSALNNVDEAHEGLVAQHNQLQTHWIATAKLFGIAPDIDSSHLIKIIVAHGKLASLIEKRNQIALNNRQIDHDLTDIEDLIIKWRQLTGSQKSLDLSTPGIALREARDILRYKDARINKLRALTKNRAEHSVTHGVVEHLKVRREQLITEWDEVFASFDLEPRAINDKSNKELLKRATIVRGLVLAWSATPGADRGCLPFTDTIGSALSIYDTSNARFDHAARLEFLKAIETAPEREYRLLLISDDQLHSLVTALAIGTGSKVTNVPAPPSAATTRPTPIAKIIRKENPQRAQDSRQLLNERARQMLDILSPRK